MNEGTLKRRLPRGLENGHILLWLVKDTCWAMEAKWAALAMIIPTLGMAFYLLWDARKMRTDAIYNSAICCWIIANTTWMVGEFRDRDWRPYAIIFFIAGLALLLVYYLFFYRKDRKKYDYIMVERTHWPLSGSPASDRQSK